LVFTVYHVPERQAAELAAATVRRTAKLSMKESRIMRFVVRLPFYPLIASVFLASGCVIAPDYEHDRDYRRHDDEGEHREHEHREAHHHCREERDCDDHERPEN
jgi:hypothetical protein